MRRPCIYRVFSRCFFIGLFIDPRVRRGSCVFAGNIFEGGVGQVRVKAKISRFLLVSKVLKAKFVEMTSRFFLILNFKMF